MEEVVGKEVAQKDVDQWLNAMNIALENREKEGVKAFVNAVVESVQKGELIFNADETITQVLKHPLGEGHTKEIVYDFRFEIGDYKKATKGISPSDEVDYAVARLSLVSKEKFPTSVFLKMKYTDYSVASKLTVFF